MVFLVVDDSPTIRRLVSATLSEFGFRNIIEASDGLDAVEVLKKNEIDIVISDWVMPNMDGIALVKHIRNDKDLFDLPVMMLTTRSEKTDVLEAIKEKVNGYIVKPFKSDEFKRKLEPLLRARNAQIQKKMNSKTLKVNIVIDGYTGDDVSLLDITYVIMKEGKIINKKVTKFERSQRQPRISQFKNYISFGTSQTNVKSEIIDENNKLADSADFKCE